MRCARLDRLAVLHHRLDAMRLHRAGETLALGLLTRVDRDGEMVARKRLVDAQHLFGFLARLRFGLVGGMTLLPEKFRRAQEQAACAFPNARRWPIG